MTGTTKNNRENYARKFFWIQENEPPVKFNPGFSANWHFKPLGPLFFCSTNEFPGLNQTAQTRRQLGIFLSFDSKRPQFWRSRRSENNTGSSEIRQNLNNWIKITYFIGAWNVFSWAATLKFAVSAKSGTKISPSSPGYSRFPMRRLLGRGWNLSSPRIFRKFSNFQQSKHLHSVSVTVLSFTPKFRITKCCSYFMIVFDHVISAILNDARQRNRNWDFFLVWSEIESGPTGKAGWHKSLRTPRVIPSPAVIISKNRLPGFSFTPYISVLRQNLLWLVWPMNLSVFAKTPSERMFLFSVFLSLLPVKV